MYTVQKNNGWNANIIGTWVMVDPGGLAIGGFVSFRAALEDAAYLNSVSQ